MAYELPSFATRLRAYPNNPLLTNLIDPSHEVLWTIVMGGFDGRLADTL